MAQHEKWSLGKQPCFKNLLKSLDELKSSAAKIGIQKKAKPTSIFQEEHDKSIKSTNDQETLIKETTEIARYSMNLMVLGLQLCATCSCRGSRLFNTYSSTLSYLREQFDVYRPPQNLLLKWERNVALIDLFNTDVGLYCNKRIAQDMFDICMETYDWVCSIANNNK